MHLLRCACPQCGTTLRVKDRAYLGRPVPCPDCRTLLVLKAVDSDHLEATFAEVSPVEKPIASRPASASTWSDGLKRWATNVTVISWAATFVVAMLITGVAFWPKRSPRPATADFSPVPASVVDEQSEPAVIEPGIPVPVEPKPWAARETDSPEDRLERLGQRLTDYLHQHDQWPRDHPPRSFLDELQPPSEVHAAGILVPEFLNPLLPETTTPAGISVTHFVGVAGVGVDAPGLPVEHPRAGIFGTQRITKPEHVTDGLSHTLLLMGVENHLGPWTDAGPATMRPLTQEPYLHGPDGFGTGQPDGMFVLLADGSVKFLADGTHPVILRRMAAMADGLPLDLSVPGDPAPPVALSEPAEPGDLPPAGIPEETEPVVMTEPLPAIDFDLALNQPLERFRQDRAVPRRELLDLLEEMLGAPIRYDVESLGTAADALDQIVSVDLQDVTVGDVLNKVLEKSDLSYEREKRSLRLRRKAEPPSEPGSSH